MTLKDENINNHVITYDTEKNMWLKCELSEDYIEKREEALSRIFLSKDGYKKRARLVVKPELLEDWDRMVDNFLDGDNKDLIWSNGVFILATLKCMERLSRGQSVDIVYRSIGNRVNPLFYGMELTPMQVDNITSTIQKFHERGAEFSEYAYGYSRCYPVRVKAKKVFNVSGEHND